jgi:cyclophilin family peptidyl-prolyl cis-trans isomerase
MKLATLSAIAMLAVGALLTPAARAQGDKPGAPKTEQPVKSPAVPATAPRGEQPAAKAPESKTAPENNVYVIIETAQGNITLELNQEKAPISSKNFLAYADKGFYNGTIFHRVISNFMVQGGGFTPDMTQKKTDATIKNEWQNGLKNTKGTVAMARLGGQADSASSQFFINVTDNSFLDQPRDGSGYAVFGRVVDGMDSVDKIKAVKTGVKNGMPDVPVEPVVMTKVRRATPEEVNALKAKLGKK